MKYLRRYSNNDGSITIEASLVTVMFVIGYLLINNIAMNIMVESITRKALFETGMEISTYIQILDEFDLRENISTESFNKEKYKDILFKGVSEIFENSSGNILGEFSKQLKTDIINQSKTKVYQEIIKSIFISKINEIKSGLNISKVGVENGLSGIEFDNIKILENGNEVELNIEYKFDLDRFGLFSFNNKINQKQIIGAWIDDNDKSINESIWKSSNFIRGRYFANLLRRKMSGVVLKQGKGIDFYDPSSNTFIQVYSVNIFDKSYSKENNKYYKISEGFFDLVKKYHRNLLENINKSKGYIEASNGETISISNPNLEVVLILPEEAEHLSDIGTHIEHLNQNFGKTTIFYMEKIFNDN